MTSQRSLVVLAAAAALLAAGCASTGEKAGPAKAGAKAPAAKPGDAKTPAAKPGDAKAPSTTASAAKPADAKAGDAKAADMKAADAKAADAKAADAKAADMKAADMKAADAKAAPAGGAKAGDSKAAGSAPAPAATSTAAGSEGGFWASYDAYMKKLGTKLEDTKFLGMQIVPRLSDEIAFTDNVYYQDNNEKLIVNRDSDFDGILAKPGLGQPRGEVSDIVNTATLGVDLSMPLNLALVPLVGNGLDKFNVFSAEVSSVEYLVHADSPDALNYKFSLDLPYLLNEMLQNLMKGNAANQAFYVRLETDYSVISDPLDVAKLDFSSAAPTFNNVGERNSFRRTEYFIKGTVGWKSPVFDSKITYRKYRLSLEDNSLKPADHYEDEIYGEIGHHLKRSEHRIYGFYEYTKYNFDNRGTYDPMNPNEDDTAALRDFGKIKTGMGWEGPLMTKKVRGGASAYYLATDAYHKGPYWQHPIDTTIGNGQAVLDKNGNVLHQRFDDLGMLAGRANLSYRPFVTKGTVLDAEYERDADFSVVAQTKIIDTGTITFTHPINDRLTGELFTNVSMENMQKREKRLYSEFGAGTRYKIAAFTEVYLRYSLRHMRSRREPVTQQADSVNEPYLIKADGDFTANIISLGFNIDF